MQDIYLNNPLLKKVGSETEFTSFEVDEMVKCYRDPIYFIENYVYIISLDEGRCLFKLYDFQKEIIDCLLNERYILIKMFRQRRQNAYNKCVYSLVWFIQ